MTLADDALSSARALFPFAVDGVTLFTSPAAELTEESLHPLQVRK